MSTIEAARKGNLDLRLIYEKLKAMAVHCRFRPGEQLNASEVSECLGVSSTPVRESLIRLQAEALLDSSRRRGFFAEVLNCLISIGCDLSF